MFSMQEQTINLVQKSFKSFFSGLPEKPILKFLEVFIHHPFNPDSTTVLQWPPFYMQFVPSSRGLNGWWIKLAYKNLRKSQN